MKALHDLMDSVRAQGREDAPGLPGAPADLLLYAPCPVKLVIRDALDVLAGEYAARGEAFTFHLPMGCTSVDPYDPIRRETDPGRLPAVIGSIGFGDFWSREFADRFVRTEVFKSAPARTLSPLHERAGLVDPRGRYTVYGATPYIFMVDTRRLGGLPLPRRWEDILHPRYKGEVVMCGDGDDMADAVVLNLYKDFGLEGLEALAANARGLMHSSSMVKSVGTSEERAGGVYVIPAFFAGSTRQPGHIRIVWPEDGAAASPLYFLAKASEHARLAPVLEFFASGFASIESAGWFAPMDGSRPSVLPPEARLKWVGWDYIEDNDVNALRDSLNARFRALVRAAR